MWKMEKAEKVKTDNARLEPQQTALSGFTTSHYRRWYKKRFSLFRIAFLPNCITYQSSCGHLIPSEMEPIKLWVQSCSTGKDDARLSTEGRVVLRRGATRHINDGRRSR